MLKSAFMGTPEIAVPALRMLAAHSDVQVVITQPDRPAGRGRHEQPSAIKVAAQALQLPIWQPSTLRGQADDPRLAGLDLIVVMAFGQILRDDVLAKPNYGCINLHGSLLPRWRGASPLQAALRAGDPITGISVMRMVRACDAGPVFSRLELALPPDAHLPWLHDSMAELAATALREFLSHWPPPTPVEQDPSLVMHCGKLERDHGHLLPTANAIELERQVRAYTPVPGCWINATDETLRIHAVALRPTWPGAVAGSAAVIAGEWQLATAEGALAVLRLQSPGGKVMAGADWLCGHAAPTQWS